jgi:hypothetical protein
VPPDIRSALCLFSLERCPLVVLRFCTHAEATTFNAYVCSA